MSYPLDAPHQQPTRQAAMATDNHAVIVHGIDDVRYEPVPSPEQRDDEVIVRIAYGGVCGSDIHYWKHGAAGESILREPMVLGHEVVGTIEHAAPDGTGPGVGTPVAVHPARQDPTTQRYPADRPNLSPGIRYLGSAARLPHTSGGFATRVALPTSMIRPLPEGLSLRQAAIAEPAAVAWHALNRAGAVVRKRVLVIGSGPIGALIVALAARAGAEEIIAVDLHELPLSIATAVGATAVLHAADTDAIANVDADIVIESSGNVHGLASAIRGATRGGRVVMVGLIPSGNQPALLSLAITRELELVGSFRFHDEMDEVLEALADGSLNVDAVVTHEFPGDQAMRALEIAADPATSGKVLLKFD